MRENLEEVLNDAIFYMLNEEMQALFSQFSLKKKKFLKFCNNFFVRAQS